MAKSTSTIPLPTRSGSALAIGLLAFAAVGLLAGGGGWLMGQQLFTLARFEIEKEILAAADTHESAHGGQAAITNIRELPPIVTNLAAPEDIWIRLEASVVLDNPSAPNTDVLVKEITGDFLAFLRTLSISQVQGAIGLQHLRQDLAERAAIRSNGRVKELVIQSMVIQ